MPKVWARVASGGSAVRRSLVTMLKYAKKTAPTSGSSDAQWNTAAPGTHDDERAHHAGGDREPAAEVDPLAQYRPGHRDDEERRGEVDRGRLGERQVAERDEEKAERSDQTGSPRHLQPRAPRPEYPGRRHAGRKRVRHDAGEGCDDIAPRHLDAAQAQPEILRHAVQDADARHPEQHPQDAAKTGGESALYRRQSGRRRIARRDTLAGGLGGVPVHGAHYRRRNPFVASPSPSEPQRTAASSPAA